MPTFDLSKLNAPAAAPGFDPAQLPPPTEADLRSERLKKIALATFAKNPGAGDIFSHDYTFGLMRPVGAVAGALGGEVGEYLGGEPASFGERYKATEQAYDENLDQARKNSGALGTVAGVAGSVLSGGPGGVASLPKAIAEGAVTSGIQSAAEAEGGLGDRAKAGAKGAITGAAGSAILGGLFSRFQDNVKVPKETARDIAQGPAPDVLRTQAKNLYKQLDDAGVAYDPTQAGTFLQNVEQTLTSEGYNPKIQTKAAGVVDEFRNRISGNQPITLDALQDLRQQARAAASTADPEDRRIGGLLMSQIDDFIEKQDPALSTSGMDKGAIQQTWKDARSKWRALNISEDLLWKVSKAERRAASTASGANTENPLRQNIRGMLDKAENPRLKSPYNEAETAAMEKVVRGTPTQNALRATGNRFGGSGPLGMSGSSGMGLGAGATLFGSGAVAPETAALLGAGAAAGLWGAGKTARMASSKMAQNNVDDLIRLVTTEGVQSPRVQAIMQGPPTREKLALMQVMDRLTAGGGRQTPQPPY